MNYILHGTPRFLMSTCNVSRKSVIRPRNATTSIHNCYSKSRERLYTRGSKLGVHKVLKGPQKALWAWTPRIVCKFLCVHTFNLPLVLKVSSQMLGTTTLKFGDREVGVRGGRSWAGFTAQWLWTKFNPGPALTTFLMAARLFPLPVQPSFHLDCYSQMLFMVKKQWETEPTRSRHKELIRAIRGNSLLKGI